MDYMRLSEIPNTLNYCGSYLDFEISELLKYSLLILQKENYFCKCYYWGKINGIKFDYHISYGYKNHCFCDEYYYSTDCINWFLLPKVDKITKLLVPLATTYFEGDPSNILTVEKDHFQHSTLNNFDSQEPLPNFIKEEDRLAAIVDLIKDEAMVVPRGGWFKCNDGSVIENPTFKGLSFLEATDLKSYLHARPPLLKWNTNLLTRPDYNYSLDFLDTIDLDVPLGCWSLKLDALNQLATLQSLYWPGLTFYHKLSTPDYGSLYMGQGMKNTAVQYMI